jgi:5'-nucleotidase
MRLAGLVVLAALVAAAPASAGPVEVQLLGINDFHGHLEPETAGRISPSGDPARAVPAGGAEYLARHLRRLERRNRNTLIVSAGDLVGASPLLSALFHDEPTIEAMNRIGLDLNAVGNHEFDDGAAELRRLQRGGCHPRDGCPASHRFKGADFRFLAANVVRERTRRPFFRPYAVRRMGGVKVGFIGLTLRETVDTVTAEAVAGLRFLDEAATINRHARRLQRRHGVKAIVVLLHEGGAQAAGSPVDGCRGIAGPVVDVVERTTRRVDLFLTGHTHAAYDCVIDGRRVTSAGSYGRAITRIDMRISRRTRDVVRTRADNWIVRHDVMKAPDITRLIERYGSLADPVRKRVIGRLERGLGRHATGNLIADAQRAAGAAAVALVHPGGVRTALGAGEVTVGRAFGVQPFGRRLVTMTLSGAQLLSVLEQQWCGQRRPEVLRVSGLTYAYGAKAAAAATGRPCGSAPSPVGDVRIAGAPVAPERFYRVAANAFLAGGGHRFTVLRSGTDRAEGPLDTEALEAHLAPSLAGAPLPPPAAGRVTRVP